MVRANVAGSEEGRDLLEDSDASCVCAGSRDQNPFKIRTTRAATRSRPTDNSQPTRELTIDRFRAAAGARFLCFFDVMAYLRRIPSSIFSNDRLELLGILRAPHRDAENCAVDFMLARARRVVNGSLLRARLIHAAISGLADPLACRIWPTTTPAWRTSARVDRRDRVLLRGSHGPRCRPE